MKKTVLLLSVLLSAFSVCANPIDATRARQIARTTLLESMERSTDNLASVEMKVIATDTKLSTPAYYVCAPVSGNGFVIVAGDDGEDEILGYSAEGTFDFEHMPPALRDILDGYSQHVAEVRCGDSQPLQRRVAGARKAKAVSALLSSSWAQSEPYNNLCPEVDGTRCLTGCVATSMSQIMYYHKYPAVGTGTVNTRFGSTGLSLNLDETPFDWDNMLDSYKNVAYTPEQATAVATLCQAAGYSAHMSYGVYFSGAYVSDAQKALINNYGYSTTAKVYLRNSYTEEGWLKKIKAELEAGRPFMYSGYTTEKAGHNFVCDGFNYKDLVHINWGWGGEYNGFYNFRILSPIKSKPEDGYSQGQMVLMGIQPMVEGEDRSIQYQVVLQDSISFERTDNDITLSLPALTNESYALARGLIYYVIKSGENEFGSIRLCDFTGYIEAPTNPQTISFAVPSDLADGDYHLMMAFRPYDSDRWFWIESGDMAANIHITVVDGKVVSSEMNTTDESLTLQVVTSVCAKPSEAVYNLQGQRVMNPRNGLFIKNGKKIIIK